MNDDARSHLERQFDSGMTLSVDELHKLVNILKNERDAMTSNWKATEKAYKEGDKQKPK